MPLTGNFNGLRELERQMRDLAAPDGSAPRMICGYVVKELRGVIKEEFDTGVGPFGAWEVTKRGKSALISKKLPQDFFGLVVPGGVFFGTRLWWLRAQHEGHTFPARKVADRKNILRFSRRGKLLKQSQFNKRKYGRAVFARGHTVGKRVLPARPLYPEGTMPGRWASRINAGAAEGMAKWYARATG